MKTPPVYKYMDSKYAENFMARGELRIGTLYDFRNIEKHGLEIGDEGEGTRTAHYTNNEGRYVDARSKPGLTQLANMFGVGIGGGEIIFGPNAIISGQLSSSDMFIFCVSQELNVKKMSEMGYDSCVVINDPEHFFSAVSTTISNIASPHDYNAVIYQDRHITLQESIETRSYLIKPDYERYVYQREFRFVWLPKNAPEHPFIDIACPAAVRFCEKII